MNYELIMFENSGVELEVNVSPEQETVWLTQEQIALLFGKSRSTITDHIRNIFEEGELKESTSVGNSDKTNHRPAKLYNLDVVLAVGHKVKSQNGVVFGKWAKDTLLLLKYKSLHSKSNLVRFEKGDLSLDVTVVPDDETVYLSKEQLVLLFNTTRQNIEYHINNIYETGELERISTCKEILQVQKEGNRQVSRYQSYYNLEMIISLGYRINNKRGIDFRRWATAVLNSYLRKGYVLNEDRALVTKDNFYSLVNRVNLIENRCFERMDAFEARLSNVEKDQNHLIVEDIFFFENQMFEALVLINQIVETAKESIVLIDPYADERTLNAFKRKNIAVAFALITSSKNKLSKIDISTYRKERGALFIRIDDTYHDRFLIIDNQLFYRLGSSINYMGKRFTEISRITATDSIALIKKRLENYSL